MLRFAPIPALLLALAPAPAATQAFRGTVSVPRAVYPYHVRITRGDEVLADRDMAFARGHAGEFYRPSWQEQNGDSCAGANHGANRSRRRTEIDMYDHGFSQVEAGVGDHVFLLEVEVVLPATTRARDGGCAAHGTVDNQVGVSQIVDLARGQTLRIDGPAGLLVEVRRP